MDKIIITPAAATNFYQTLLRINGGKQCQPIISLKDEFQVGDAFPVESQIQGGTFQWHPASPVISDSQGGVHGADIILVFF